MAREFQAKLFSSPHDRNQPQDRNQPPTPAIDRVSFLRKRFLRPLLRTLQIAAIGALVYELALNAFLLSGGLARALSGEPDTVLIQYRSAWSLLPGFVHARGLRIRSKDSSIEFDLRIARCDFRVALRDLLRRSFHVLRVRGDGITFVARRRIAPADATPRTLEALPHIEGLEPVPLKGPEPPPLDDAHYNLVTIELDRVDAESVHEIWLDSVRFVGDAHVVGGFFLRPIRWASVGPVLAYVRTGRVTSAKDVLAANLHGQTEATVDGFDPRETHGAEVLRRVSVRATLDADLPTVAFVQRWLGNAPLTFSGGEGSASIDVTVRHGHVEAPGRVQADVRRARIGLSEGAVVGDLHASARVAAAEDSVRLDGGVTAQDVRLEMRGFQAEPVRMERADLHLGSHQLDLAEHPFSDAAVSAQLPVVQILDARFVNAWLPNAGARVMGGGGTVDAEFELTRLKGTGSALLAIDALQLALGNALRVGGQVRARANLSTATLASGRIGLSGSRVEVLGVSGLAGTQGWWANLEATKGELDLLAGPVVRATLLAEARDTRPLADPLIKAQGLPDWLVPVLSANDLRASAQVRVDTTTDTLEVRALQAHAGVFWMQAEAAKHGAASRAVALVGAGAFSLGAEVVNGKASFQLVGTGDWYRKRTASPILPSPQPP